MLHSLVDSSKPGWCEDGAEGRSNALPSGAVVMEKVAVQRALVSGIRRKAKFALPSVVVTLPLLYDEASI